MADEMVSGGQGAEKGLGDVPESAREAARRELGSSADIEFDTWDEDTEVIRLRAEDCSAELEALASGADN